jgi:hypothetical protein
MLTARSPSRQKRLGFFVVICHAVLCVALQQLDDTTGRPALAVRSKRFSF